MHTEEIANIMCEGITRENAFLEVIIIQVLKSQ